MSEAQVKIKAAELEQTFTRLRDYKGEISLLDALIDEVPEMPSEKNIPYDLHERQRMRTELETAELYGGADGITQRQKDGGCFTKEILIKRIAMHVAKVEEPAKGVPPPNEANAADLQVNAAEQRKRDSAQRKREEDEQRQRDAARQATAEKEKQELDELAAVLDAEEEALRREEEELDQAFRELDQDGSGEIEFFEFVEWFTSED